VWTLSGVALAALALSVTGLQIGTPADEAYRNVPDSVTGQAVLGEHFPAGESAPTLVVTQADSADAVRRAIDITPGVDRVADARPAAGQVLFTVVLDDAPDSPVAEETVIALRDALADKPDVLVGGSTARTLDTATAAADDRVLVMGAVFVVVLLVLTLLLRAVVAPLVLLATVVLSYLAALGAGGLLMRALGFDSLDVSLPLLAFVFLVALGVDYTIFLVSRVREEVPRHGSRAGMLRGLVVTGGVITSAGLVLAATFGVLTTMPSAGMIGLGVIVGMGILLDTFVVRSLLVPAIAVDLGTGFWFPRRDVRP
jgi:RND superfamily putative drug exporter